MHSEIMTTETELIVLANARLVNHFKGQELDLFIFWQETRVALAYTAKNYA